MTEDDQQDRIDGMDLKVTKLVTSAGDSSAIVEGLTALRQVSQTDSGEPHLDTKHQGDFNPPATASLYRDLLTKANYQAEHHPANAATGPGNKIGEILYSREAPGIIDLSKGPDNIWKVVPTLEPFQVIPITILMSLFGGSAKQVLNDAGIKIPRLIEKNNLAQGLLAVR